MPASTPSTTATSSATATPRTPSSSSKPRAGRKRWALNFGSKTGSLKSIKSDRSSSTGGGHAGSGDDELPGGGGKHNGSGFGKPMMLATLYGLTR